jgi:hypothetical protein
MESSGWTSLPRSGRPRYLEWLRLLSSYLILTYGVRKLIGSGQFGLAHSLSARPVGTLSGYELTWYYFGYSHAYGIIIGLTQVVGGALLLFRRSAVLGALVLTPVMANILMINVFFTIAVGAEVVAAFVLISSLLLLWQERRRLIAVFWSSQQTDATQRNRAEQIAAAIVVILLIVEAVIFAKHPTR